MYIPVERSVENMVLADELVSEREDVERILEELGLSQELFQVHQQSKSSMLTSP